VLGRNTVTYFMCVAIPRGGGWPAPSVEILALEADPPPGPWRGGGRRGRGTGSKRAWQKLDRVPRAYPPLPPTPPPASSFPNISALPPLDPPPSGGILGRWQAQCENRNGTWRPDSPSQLSPKNPIANVVVSGISHGVYYLGFSLPDHLKFAPTLVFKIHRKWSIATPRCCGTATAAQTETATLSAS
jgi:hypothetical protein